MTRKSIEYLGINVPLEKMCSRLDLNSKSPGSAYLTSTRKRTDRSPNASKTYWVVLDLG
jgi:hypothetical protein